MNFEGFIQWSSASAGHPNRCRCGYLYLCLIACHSALGLVCGSVALVHSPLSIALSHDITVPSGSTVHTNES